MVNLLHRIHFGEEFSKNGNLRKALDLFVGLGFLTPKRPVFQTFIFGMEWIT